MNSQRPLWLTLPERFLALLLLAVLLPPLLEVAFVIYFTSGSPVFLTDQGSASGHAVGRVLRFRTAGSVGRFLKKYSIDALPALWSVVSGEIRLRDLSKLG